MHFPFSLTTDAEKCLAFMNLPMQIREDLGFLVECSECTDGSSQQDLSKLTPLIKFKGSIMETNDFDIVSEGVTVTTVQSFYLAVIYVLCIYYIFNIAYPPSLKNTLTFIQKVIVGHADTTKALPKIGTLLSRLNML